MSHIGDDDLKAVLVASLMMDAFEGGDWRLAKQHWEETEMTNDERLEVWGFFSGKKYSRERAYLNDDDRQYLKEAGLQE